MRAKIGWIVLLWLCGFSLEASGQVPRFLIKAQIDAWGSCRSVAITSTGGCLALHDDNDCVYTGLPAELSQTIEELRAAQEYIDDIQLTDEGRWLILYGDNGMRWHNLPSDLEKTIRRYNYNRELITSVAFNDKGDWFVISEEYISASSTELYGWIEEGVEQYGQLWAAHLTDDGLVLCYEEGYKFLGNIPEPVKEALRATWLNVYRAKFLPDGSFFIADEAGNCDYSM